MKRRKKKKSIDSSKAIEYDYHLPVLLNEAIDFLITDRNGIYVDGTLGGGGHSSVILEKLESKGHLYSFDMDPDAIVHCKEKFKEELSKESPKISLINENFYKACSIEGAKGKVSGILLDLGVSSHQLDSYNRGISYRFNSDLDMRFGTDGKTARDILHVAKEEELVTILRKFGEEPFSKRIARRIIELRRANSLNSSFDLRKAVEESVPPHLLYDTLSRVFQAIRIAVNSELTILEDTIANIVPQLKKNGRIVIISYHSLEDKIVKNKFKELASKSRPAMNDDEKMYSNFVEIIPQLRIITKKPIVPSNDELEINPRSRSAKLRVAEKIID